MGILDGPFIGSDAIVNGLVRKHELRTSYRAVFPDVYLATQVEPTLAMRARAGWLWSHREGVVAGLTASALHGSKWVDDKAPIELIWPNARAAEGLRTYDMRLRTDEFRYLDGMRVTTPARTGFDIGRRRSILVAVTNLDALGAATGLRASEVESIARVHRGARWIRRLDDALRLYDPGAASPKETWLRLLAISDGYPPPRTQIPVRSPDGNRQYYLDMGWEDRMLALEYDGEQHRTDPVIYAYDIQRAEDIAALGWTRIVVVKSNRAADVLQRLDRAWRSSLSPASSLLTDREIS
jgi:hypothetical protein